MIFLSKIQCTEKYSEVNCHEIYFLWERTFTTRAQVFFEIRCFSSKIAGTSTDIAAIILRFADAPLL